jgi:hypothetical protein
MPDRLNFRTGQWNYLIRERMREENGMCRNLGVVPRSKARVQLSLPRNDRALNLTPNEGLRSKCVAPRG